MITQKYLKECLHYNENTGVLTWIKRPRHHFNSDRAFDVYSYQRVGVVAGSVHNNGKAKFYIRVKVGIKKYYAHRLIYLYMTGNWPDEIDHVDGDGLNNKWINLRNVSRLDNCKNTKISKRNTSGHVGVFIDNGKYRAVIYKDGKAIYLGSYNHITDAISARKEADVKYNYHPLHGSEPCQKERLIKTDTFE